jgi:hypothetical protein
VAGAVQHLEVGQRIFLDHHQVGELAGSIAAEATAWPSACAPLSVAERITSSGWKPASRSISISWIVPKP